MRALLQRRLGAVQRARAVVRPATTADVVAILAWAHQTRTPVVPYGLGSGVCGAVLVSRGEVVIDLGKMTRAGAIDETSLTVTVQPGIRGSSLESSLSAAGYTTGHYPQSIELSSVGGWCATRAIGQFSTKYGGIEDVVLGLEAVLPGGRTIRLPAVPRTSTGPDLRELFLGSEGTLGVLTELTLRVHPSPASRAARCFTFSTVEAGMETLRLALREGWRPAVTRLYDATESARNFSLPGPIGATLLLLSEGPGSLVAAESEALRAIAIGQGGTDQGADPVDHWMGHRNRVPRFEDLVDQGLVVDTIEVAVGWKSLARLFGEVVRAGSAVPDMLSMSGHVSHCYLQGANIYFTFVGTCKDPQTAIDFYDRVWELTMQYTHSLGGTIAHHHGIGRVRKHWLRAELGSALDLLQQIKATVDPHGIMNPGALLDGA
jgi:alkyldihydroxyacetonephosphate synthase